MAEITLEYYELVRCRPVYIYDNAGNCLDDTVANTLGCFDDDKLWYPVRISTDTFMFQNFESGQCLADDGANALITEACDPDESA